MANIKISTNDNTMKYYSSKAECFEKLPNQEVYVSRDIKKNEAFKSFSATSFDNLIDVVRKGDHHMYEIIKTDAPRYSYFDLDAKIDTIKKYYKDVDNIEDKIIEDFEIAIEEFKLNNDIECDTDLVVMSASSDSKISLHMVDREVTLANKDDCKAYHDTFRDYLKEDTPELMMIMDNAVYDSDRNFRMVNQSKWANTPRRLEIKSHHREPHTLVTNVPKDATHLKIPKRWLKTKTFIQPIKENLEEFEQTELGLLTEHLSDVRFQEYPDWLKTVWCLYACGATSELIHIESNNRCPKKYDFDTTESCIKQYNHEKSKYSIETLKIWAKQDSNFEIERVVEKVAKQQPTNKEDHFQFLDLLRKYQGANFPLKAGLDEFCKEASLCVSMVLSSEVTFSMYSNEENQFDLTKKIPKLSFSYTIELNGQESPPIKTDLQKYMVDNPLSFPLYNKIVFRPNNVGVKKAELNVWGGFKAQEVETIDMEIVNVFNKHVKEIWANNNEEYYKYIMSWIAQVIKTPEKKTEVAILLQGGQGTGKTLPCDILLERVFGTNIGMTASGLGSLTQRFNGSTMGKIFANVNELSIVDGDNFNASFDKMKSLVTDRRIQIEKKGMEHITIDNLTNFIMTTNHRHTIKLEADDRRYACFEVGNSHKQDGDYFANFMDALDNDEAGNHLYTYFLRYPESEMVNIRKIPMTAIKAEMLESSKTNVERFVKGMNDEFEHDELYNWTSKDGNKAITCSHFYDLYKRWCSENGEKSWSHKAVGSELKTKGLCTQDQNRNGEKKARYYEF